MALGEEEWVLWGAEGAVEEVEWVLSGFYSTTVSCAEIVVLTPTDLFNLPLLLEFRSAAPSSFWGSPHSPERQGNNETENDM